MDGVVRVQLWGPGAQDAAARVPPMLGFDDSLVGFDPTPHPLVAELARRHPGLRFGHTDDLFATIVPTVIGQLVTTAEAKRSYAQLVFELGERAPGPRKLWMAPAAERLADAPSWLFHRVGLERRRAEIIVRLARRAGWIRGLTELAPPEVRAKLELLPGIGPWTSTKAVQIALGDPDSVVVGDYNLPHRVSWLLAGERRADDARMLELLSPFPGHRARVVRLLGTTGERPPRRGPRRVVRDYRRM